MMISRKLGERRDHNRVSGERAGRHLLSSIAIGVVSVGLLSGAALAGDLSSAVGPSSNDSSDTSAARAAALDSRYLPKEWISVQYPSFADTLTQDNDRWRTTLAQYGFGFSVISSTIFEANMLNTPSKVPAMGVLPNGKPAPWGAGYSNCTAGSTICPGGQAYIGQSPMANFLSFWRLTYDTSRWGVPDGQIMTTGVWSSSTNDNFVPDQWLTLSTLLWYQTLFDKRVELWAGYSVPTFQYMGTNISGNYASTFGPTASIPALAGVGNLSGVPGVTVRWHATKNIYNQAGVYESFPVNGPTANPYINAKLLNPTGLNWGGTGARALVIDEAGWLNEAAPGTPKTWLRAGFIHNYSDFTNPSNPLATVRGSDSGYALVDRQLWQQAASSPATAYRGIYAGATGMWGDRALGVTSYYEGRLYWIGPSQQRATDLISFVYARTNINKNAVSAVDGLTQTLNGVGLAGPQAVSFSNQYTLSYLAHLRPGLYASVGVSYADNPSFLSFNKEGHALSFLTSLNTAW